jgi:hypothetical protein
VAVDATQLNILKKQLKAIEPKQLPRHDNP